jgi:hypothetical protein
VRRSAAALGLALAATAWLAAAWPVPARGEPLAVTAHRIERFGVPGGDGARRGPLRFLGGLDLAFDDPRASGLSGIAVLPDGRGAVLVSDQGYAVRARLAHEGGRLSGLADAAIAPLFPGRAPDKREGDAEDIALDPENPAFALVAFERRRTPVLRFRLTEKGLEEPQPVRVLQAVRELGRNRGLESLAIAPDGSKHAGRIVVVMERARAPGAQTIPGWILGVGAFEIRRRDGFDVTSARFLPDGDLLLLEWRLLLPTGFGMRLRRIAADDLGPGATLDGDILLEAGTLQGIDNMEGLAVHEDEAGRTVLTLVSDDNGNVLQRTILLQFALEDGASG